MASRPRYRDHMHNLKPHTRRTSAAQSQYGYRAREWAGQPLGTIFVAYREAYGKTLEEAAQDLCLRRAHLRALESGAYGDLPEFSYSSGFVRSYAKYLGLPAEEMVSRFREHYADQSDRHALKPRMSSLQSGALVAYSPRWPSFAVLVIAALLLGASYMVMAAYTAATNPRVASEPGLEFVSGQVAPTEVVSTDPLDDFDIFFEIDEGTDDPIDIVDETLTQEPVIVVEEVLTDVDQVAVYGVAIPQARPEVIDVEPQALEPTDLQHRVVIRATGRAHLTILDHETSTPFLRAEYQRGDSYLVPNDKIVRLLSTDVDRLEIIIDGIGYRVAPAIAALNDPLVLDPDTIVGTTQLIRIDTN